MQFSTFKEYMKKLENKNALLVAISYILVGYFFHAVQIIFFKSGHFTIIPQSLFIRSFISFITLFLFQRDQDFYPKGKMRVLIESQTVVAVGSLFYFYGLTLVSVSEATIIFATNTIWSQLIVSFMNKERITKSRLVNSIICIIGIILIVNPTLENEDSIGHIIGATCVLICSIIQSYGFVIMKSIGKEVPTSIVSSYFHLTLIFTSTLQQQFIGKFEYFEGYFFYLIGFTVFMMLGQLFQYRAQTLVTYDKICNYTYSQMIYVIILDYLIFQKILSLNGFLGGLCIIAGVFKQLHEDKQITK